jgi:5-methylcytosine-specific restriction endonuclease McrA
MPRSFENSSYTDIDKYKEHVKKTRLNTKIKIQEYIETKKKPCLFCGSTEQIEFHHFNPTEKEKTVSSFLTFKKVDAELAKCWCLCSSCHKKLHRRMCDPLPICYKQ